MSPDIEFKFNSPDLVKICEQHEVESLYAFGSSVTNRFDDNKSDIDLVVEIKSTDPLQRGELLISLWDKLEAYFQKKVDLLTDNSIKNPFLKKNIESTKVLIYGG